MLIAFVFSLFMFNMVGVVIDYVEHIDEFIRRKAPGRDIALFYINFFPWVSALFCHLFLFISVIFFTSKMAYQSEIIAILSTGVSFNRFLRPFLVVASIVFFVLYFSNHMFVPVTNKVRFKIQELYLFPPSESSDKNKHLRLSPSEYLYTESYNSNTNRATNFTYEKYDTALNIIKKIYAISAKYDSTKHTWLLYSGVIVKKINDIEDKVEFFDSFKNNFGVLPGDFFEETRPKEELTSSELKRKINKSIALGLVTNNFLYVELYRRTANAFSVFFFVLIAVSIASVKVRGGSGIHLAIGVIMSAVFIFIQQFTYTFSTKGSMHPIIAVWLPNVLLAIITYVIYKRRLKN